jgi:hypothetical protein
MGGFFSFNYRERSEAQKTVLDLLRKIRPFSVAGFEKIRIGSGNDGGYVCVDDLAPIACCISCGIGDNDDFDLDLARQGISVLQFDHTIEAAPSRHEKLRFFKERIAARPENGAKTLSSLVQTQNGQGPCVLLKIDIEGDEWPVFDDLPEKDLACFRQIVAEFHGLEQIFDSLHAARMNRVFAKLEKHFFACHVHANNCCPMSIIGGVPMPHLIEVTFASRLVYEPTDSKQIFPTSLDAPNDAARADYRLGCFWF